MPARTTANFARPANTTAYASGDLVANDTTAGNVVPMEFDVAGHGVELIRRAQIKKSATGVTNASFRLHLYDAAPTVTNGDNGAWLSTESGYLGAIDVTVDKVFSDASGGTGVPLNGAEITMDKPWGTRVYGLLEARAAYTPASGEVFTVTLEVISG